MWWTCHRAGGWFPNGDMSSPAAGEVAREVCSLVKCERAMHAVAVYSVHVRKGMLVETTAMVYVVRKIARHDTRSGLTRG